MKSSKTILLAAVAAAMGVASGAEPSAQSTQVQVSVTQTPAVQPQPAQVQPQTLAAPARPERVIVAVGKFDDTDGSSADDAAQLRERVLHRVVGTRKFEVVERADLKKVVSEINYGRAGLTESSSAPREGMLKAAGFVVYGKLLFCGVDSASARMVGLATTRERFKCEFELKLADCETGRILASKVVVGSASRSAVGVAEVVTKGATSSDPLQRDAIDEAAAFAVDEIRELLYPARVVRVDSRHVTVNMTSEEVRIGDIFDVFEDGGTMRDPDTGASLGCEGEYIGRMKAVIPGAKTSRFEPIGTLRIGAVRPGCVIRRVSKQILESERRGDVDKSRDRFMDRS